MYLLPASKSIKMSATFYPLPFFSRKSYSMGNVQSGKRHARLITKYQYFSHMRK